MRRRIAAARMRHLGKSRQTNRRVEPLAPLLGFGVVGWVVASIAVALGVVLVTEYDLRYQLMRLIAAVFGTDAMMRFVVSLHWHGLDFFPGPPGVRFGLVTMCLVMIAMQVHGRRFGWWAWALVVVAGLGIPEMHVALVNRVSSWLPAPANEYDPIHAAKAVFLSQVICAFASATAVGIALRSWKLGLMFAVFWVAGSHLELEIFRVAMGEPPLLIDPAALGVPIRSVQWAWSPLIFGVLLTWAIVARRRWRPAHACAACGYDLRGAVGGVCPECGGARETPGGSGG